MDVVNETLKQLGSAVECSGGGGGRSMSYADLIIRLRSAQSSLTDMSGQVLGTVLVESEADFSLMPGESLQTAMEDPHRGGAIKASVQEAYGMAVVDEAPVFMLTSYNVSVFFKRSNDVEDKRLWASEPIWINQIDPSACAIWAQALQQAEELRGWKPMLQRAKVPPKVEEEADSLLSLSSLSDPARRRAADSSEPASSRSSASNASSVHSSPVVPSAHSGLGLSSVNGGPALSRKRRHADQQDTDAFRTPVSHMQRGGPCPRSHLNAYSPQSLAFQTYNHAAAAPEPAARDFEVEDTLPLSELGLTGELLGVCQHGYTLKGTWEGDPVSVKVFNLRQRGAATQYETEKFAYRNLPGLQGHTIPRFLRDGLQAHTAAPVIVTSYEGKALAEDEPVPGDLREHMEAVLQSLHGAGAAHGAVSASCFVVKGKSVRLVNFGKTVVHATPKARKMEMTALKALL